MLSHPLITGKIILISDFDSMLALNVLIEHADCVLPVDNQALFDIVGRIDG